MHNVLFRLFFFSVSVITNNSRALRGSYDYSMESLNIYPIQVVDKICFHIIIGAFLLTQSEIDMILSNFMRNATKCSWKLETFEMSLVKNVLFCSKFVHHFSKFASMTWPYGLNMC